jgi:Protein of unknown function (DUF3987)
VDSTGTIHGARVEINGSPASSSVAVALIAAHWPKGARQQAACALAGGLLRGGWEAEATEQFIEQVAIAAQDEEVSKRVEVVRTTAEKLKAGDKVTGWPNLATLLGAEGIEVVRKVRVALGLTIALADLARHKGLPAEFLEGLGLHDLPEGGVGLPYRDGGGRTVAVKMRTALKAGMGSFWPKGKCLMAYGEERLEDAAQAGYQIINEGESDCWTLWFHGFPALGLPGADTVAKTLALGHLGSRRQLYVVQEPDQGGETFVANVAERARAIGWNGEILVVRLDGCKDPSELHLKNPDGFKAAFQAALNRATPYLGRPQSDPPGKKTVRALTPYVPFPVGALPEPIREYVSQGALALGCDPAYIALPALAVAASAIGNTRTIRLKRGWDEPSVVWTAIVGESGTLKSPAYLKAVAYLFKIQRDMLALYREHMKQYKEDMKAYKEAKDDGTATGPPPEKPVFERVIASDTTIEKVAEILEDNPRGILVARDELAGWLGSFTRYKGKGGGTDLPYWLEIHRAGTILYDRKTGERTTVMVPQAAASVTGGIQPGVLVRALTPEFLDAGLAARLLLAMPTAPPKRWSEIEIDPPVEEAYQKAITSLLALGFDTIPGGEDVPHALRLSPEAKAAWVAFYNAWAREQAAAEGELAAAFSKLEGYAARFALLHHVASRVARGENDRAAVEKESIEAGVTLCRWFANEARRIYATLSESREERDARRLVEFIQTRGGRISARDLMRSNNRKYPQAAHAEAALEALVTSGHGQWIDCPTTVKGGHPTRVFHLCMTHDTTDTTPDGEDEGGEEAMTESAHDTTSNGPPKNGMIPREVQGSVGSVMRRAEVVDGEKGPTVAAAAGGFAASGGSEVVSCGDGWVEGEV